MIIETIPLKKGVVLAVKLEMLHAPLLVIRAEKGFVMCGYLDITTADKLGDIACKVRGVNNFEDVLNAKVVEVTAAAKAIGINEGMSGREALELMC
jgi:uncharacterized protein YunC (DUF1805 family)